MSRQRGGQGARSSIPCSVRPTPGPAPLRAGFPPPRVSQPRLPFGPPSPGSPQSRVPSAPGLRLPSIPGPLSPGSFRPQLPLVPVHPAPGPSAPAPPPAPSPPGPSAPPRLCWPHSWVGSAWAPVRPQRRGDPSPVLALAQAAGWTAFWAWCPGRRAAGRRCRPLRLLLTGFGGSGRLCESSHWAPLALGLVYRLLWGLTTWRGRPAESLRGPAAVVPGTLAALQGVGVFLAEWSSNVFRFRLWT